MNIKEFIFTDKQDFVSVKICENPATDYGSFIWPCAPVLAQYVWQNKQLVKGCNVIEIGAGTGLPGIVAAKCGANVILSDSITYTSCLDLCRNNAELNGLSNITVTGITWGEMSTTLINLPKIDFILGSDCFYNSKDFENVIMTLSFILHRSPDAKVWCAYQERSSERSIEFLLDKWLLQGHEVCLPNMEDLKSFFDGYLKHTIRMFIISKK
ncbi:Methyltransferase-like protein 23 [Bulinus truncatus]|nr:Methyltransferase-like protein 23 [Bulinus truncatus]